MSNFNEWTNTLLYKNMSLTLYSRKGWCWLCVRSELGTHCYILTQSSSDHCSTSSSSWLGLLNRGSLRAARPQLASCPPTDSNSNWNWPKPSVAPGYIIVSRHLLPLFLHLFTQVHLLIDGSVEGQWRNTQHSPKF